MKILALDIGAGTEDVLLYDDRKESVENCIKMVLPSPSQVYAEKVREATRLSKAVSIKGDIIGGGAFAYALKRHVEKGLRVVMTESAAYTVRNDLNDVRDLGIEIAAEENEFGSFKGTTLAIEEISLEKLQDFLSEFGETLSDVDIVAIAVQDHGVSSRGISNRRFRTQKMKELLKKDQRPENLAFTEKEIPSCNLRMKSAVLASKRQLPSAEVVLMDTASAAILGCMKDPLVEKANPVLAVNVGNGHTMAAIVSGGKIVGVMEHHTRLLDLQKIEQFLIAFGDGKLSDQDVFNDNGHGLFFLQEPPGFSKIATVAATGPNRSILAKTNLSVHFAAPAGDVMMTGPMGLVEATKRKFNEG